MATKYTVYADFELNGKQYKKGGDFSPPSEMEVDQNFIEFRNATREKQIGDTKLGTPFLYEVVLGRMRNPETGVNEDVKDHRRVVLPVLEKGASA